MKTLTRLVALSATAVLGTLGLGIQAANAATIRVVSCSSSGQFASCFMLGTARHHPGKIVLHVRVSPSQAVDVDWSLDCSRGFAFSSNSGSFTATTPINRTLHHSLFHPDACDIDADVSLHDVNKSGNLTAWITYTPWG